MQTLEIYDIEYKDYLIDETGTIFKNKKILPTIKNGKAIVKLYKLRERESGSSKSFPFSHTLAHIVLCVFDNEHWNLEHKNIENNTKMIQHNDKNVLNCALDNLKIVDTITYLNNNVISPTSNTFVSWKQIPVETLESYYVSEYGDIYYTETMNMRTKPPTTKMNIKEKTIHIHSLVAKLFLPNSLHSKNLTFKDGDSLNWHFSNLEWGRENKNSEESPTQKSNTPHRSANVSFGVLLIDENLNILKKYTSTHVAGKELSIDPSTVRRYCAQKNITKKCKNYLLCYENDYEEIKNGKINNINVDVNKSTQSVNDDVNVVSIKPNDVFKVIDELNLECLYCGCVIKKVSKYKHVKTITHLSNVNK